MGRPLVQGVPPNAKTYENLAQQFSRGRSDWAVWRLHTNMPIKVTTTVPSLALAENCSCLYLADYTLHISRSVSYFTCAGEYLISPWISLLITIDMFQPVRNKLTDYQTREPQNSIPLTPSPLTAIMKQSNAVYFHTAEIHQNQF